MNTLDEFTEYHAELLDGGYDCMDRLVLNAYFPVGMTGGGVRSWWRLLHGDDSKLDDGRLREMAGTFSRRLSAFCAQQKIPLIAAQAGERKHEVAKTVQAKRYDLTVFKIHWGNLTLKIYDKGARVLRIEVVVHNTKALRCGKVLEKLPVLLERMRAMLVRFLNTVQAAHVSFLDAGTFERWSEPSARGNRRLAGIDLNKVRNRHVLNAVVTLSTAPEGFTVAEVAAKVRDRGGWSAQQYAPRHAAYDLAKLRGKNLIDRPVRSHRFNADPAGMRTMCAYLLLREQVIKPLLAGVTRPRGRPPKTVHPLDRHYIRLREEMHDAFGTLGLAA